MPSVTGSRSLPQGSLEELARYMTDGYWEDRGAIRHAFDTSSSTVITVDLTTLEDQGAQLARWALQAWELVADISFREVADGADIVFDDAGSGAEAGANWTVGDGAITSAWVRVGAEWIAHHGSTVDSYGFSTYLHEIGHALGLGHLGDYDGDANFGTDATFANDSWQLSAMSYFTQEDNPNTDADRAELITAMQADIVAIQDLYGAGAGTRGDTVWGLDSNVGGYLGETFDAIGGGAARPGLYGGAAVALTIYDAGGTDTLNLRTSVTDDRIDMAQGAFSDIDGVVGNLAIAQGTILENLRAGSGSDHILGNGAGNEIYAGAGADRIWTRAGDDSVYAGDGHDVIGGADGDDFLFGNGGHDTIYGGGGADTLGGGAGDDRLLGFAGDDRLYGAAGDDELSGHRGRDTIWGGDGDDVVRGGGHDDVISVGAGSDDVMGHRGDDTVYAAGGEDVVTGGDGADEIWGGGGGDWLFGQNGHDTIRGGTGDDLLSGGNGRDVLTGGDGADAFVFETFGARDVVTDFDLDEGDRLRLDAGLGEGAFDEAAAMILEFARIEDGGTVLDFHERGTLVLADFTDIDGLAGQSVFA